ncbi:MAG: SIMPL domain-containing protein [Acidobacteria bacterium]|nr:SIMPL domain-containing protein [Acidobacteriota bacterium]
MNGERNNYWFNAGVALAVGLILSSLIFGWFFAKARKGDEVVTVTGAARKRIKSDLVVWTAAVTYQAPKLADAYRSLSENVPRVKQYLLGKGIPENEITVSSIATTPLHKTDENGQESSEITGYSLRQQLEVRSNDVDRVAQLAREATELIDQGILIESNPPQYYYTKLGDLKIEMLGEAAKDAKTRAEKIAASTGNRIGTVRSAKMGVMQITAADSTEVSDEGISDTTAIDKDITAVVNTSFAVE